MKRLFILLGALGVFACGDATGEVLHDAGDMMGGGVGDAGAQGGDPSDPGSTPSEGGWDDYTVDCDQSATRPFGADGEQVYYWAEFPIDAPGVTEVTTCYDPFFEVGAAPRPPNERPRCHRGKIQWFDGTSTGFIECGSVYRVRADDEWIDNRSVRSITVHEPR